MYDCAFEGCDSGFDVYCGALGLEPAKAASVANPPSRQKDPPDEWRVNGGQARQILGIILDFGRKVNQEGQKN